MTEILQFDYHLFHLINAEWRNAFLDAVMPIIRSKYVWYPVYVGIIAWAFTRYKSKLGFLYVVSLLSCVAVTDLLSSSVLKPLVQRLRPCNELLSGHEVVLNVSCGYGYSFPSSHAANHFALSILCLLLFKANKPMSAMLILWAALICYAQMYVGVHYPLDVLGGALLGILMARLWYTTTRRFSISEM
jgi:undecaprenyl-diphosphatase